MKFMIKLFSLWACGITPLLSTVSKSSAASVLGGRTVFKSRKKYIPQKSEQSENDYFNLF
jgi:hypothetical protein